MWSTKLAHQDRTGFVRKAALLLGDAVPKPLGFSAILPSHRDWKPNTEPRISVAHPRPGWYGLAPESALGSHPCVALSSAPVHHSVNQTRPAGAGKCPSLIENCLRNPARQGITDLVLGLLRWPVFKWPRMAGFQVAAEALPEIVLLVADASLFDDHFSRCLLYTSDAADE